MTDDVQKWVREARLRALDVPDTAVQGRIEIDVVVVRNVARLLANMADALEAATSAPAVDREALVWQLYDLLGGDTALGNPFMPDEGIAHNARSVANALLAAGLLRDVRDVQAEALEQAEEMADRIVEDAEERRRAVRADGEYWQGFSRGASKVSWSIHKRAQAIREARNER